MSELYSEAEAREIIRRSVLIEEARRAKTAVYLATDASVADDLSRIIGGLADALEAAGNRPVPRGEPSGAQVEFPFTHGGVTLEQDDGGLWVQLDANEFTTGEHHPYWIGPRALAALRAAGEVR